MPDKGQFSISYTDYDGEHSVFGFTTALMTAGNLVAQTTLKNTLIAAAQAMVLGNRWKNQEANVTINNITNASDDAAQVELKWLIQYHDGTTLKRYSMELPTANTAKLDPNDRAHAEIGDAGDVDDFITALQAYALTPDGNAVVVDEITLVGRPY
jgi:hypothetical protein